MNVSILIKSVFIVFCLTLACSPAGPPKENKSPCSRNTDCKSDRCEDSNGKKICLPGTKKGGESCYFHASCVSLACDAKNPDDPTVKFCRKERPPPKDFGQGPCAIHEHCKSTLCIQNPVTKERYCSKKCTPDAPCPKGYTCQELFSGGGACAKGPKTIGEFCKEKDECEFKLCESYKGKTFCTRSCTQEDCPEGYRCLAASSGKACLPIPKKVFGEGCRKNDECVSNHCLLGANGSYCTKICSDGCEGNYLCQSDFKRNLTCRRYEGGPDGKCKKNEIQAWYNCQRRCAPGQPECIKTCNTDILDKDCYKCTQEYNACPAKNKCSPSDSKCCKDKRVECFGKPPK